MMNTRRMLLVALAAVLLSAVGIACYRALPDPTVPVAQGQERPRRPVVVHPNVPDASHARSVLPGALRVHPSRLDMPSLRARTRRTPVRSRRSHASHVRRAPRAPLNLRQIGGLEPAMRVLAAGVWINSTSFDVVLRMA